MVIELLRQDGSNLNGNQTNWECTILCTNFQIFGIRVYHICCPLNKKKKRVEWSFVRLTQPANRSGHHVYVCTPSYMCRALHCMCSVRMQCTDCYMLLYVVFLHSCTSFFLFVHAAARPWFARAWSHHTTFVIVRYFAYACLSFKLCQCASDMDLSLGFFYRFTLSMLITKKKKANSDQSAQNTRSFETVTIISHTS